MYTLYTYSIDIRLSNIICLTFLDRNVSNCQQHYTLNTHSTFHKHYSHTHRHTVFTHILEVLFLTSHCAYNGQSIIFRRLHSYHLLRNLTRRYAFASSSLPTGYLIHCMHLRSVCKDNIFYII